MQHLRTLESISLPDSQITIGTYDGVHIGHLAIINPMVEQAHQRGVPAAVITFYPHPAIVLKGIKEPVYLTAPEERAEILAGTGVDFVITLKFDQNLAAMTSEAFMRLIHSHLRMKKLWVGYDFALGRDRLGDISNLQKLGHSLGYQVNVIPQVNINHEPVSSRLIRCLLEEGNITEASQKLGRLYSIQGKVVHGSGRGKDLGFSTANLDIWPEKLIPASGVYATWAWLDNRKYQSVTSVGYNPTFHDLLAKPRVEVYLLDFNQNIYGKELRVEFVQYLRPENRYSSVSDLQDQIAIDIINSREVLSHAE